MWSIVSTSVGFTLLVFLAVAVLPVPRVRRLLLTGTAHLVQAAVLAFLGACGTFFVDPQAAPDWLTAVARPPLEGTLGLPLSSTSGWPWLLLAVLGVALSLPLLMIFELVVNLSSLTTLVQTLRKEVRQAATWVNGRLAALGASGPAYPAWTEEAVAAAEALSGAGQEGKHGPSAPEPLVLDLLNK
jgi:hypothetical protein